MNKNRRRTGLVFSIGTERLLEKALVARVVTLYVVVLVVFQSFVSH
jgi:hypothetical protein